MPPVLYRQPEASLQYPNSWGRGMPPVLYRQPAANVHVTMWRWRGGDEYGEPWRDMYGAVEMCVRSLLGFIC